MLNTPTDQDPTILCYLSMDKWVILALKYELFAVRCDPVSSSGSWTLKTPLGAASFLAPGGGISP
jgi:hypothetical protein